MVRLGDEYQQVDSPYQFISIPLWCDWEMKQPRTRNTIIHFNSTMVRLGASEKSMAKDIFRNFNSTMVRLGVSAAGAAGAFFPLFQFHYGAIGST